MDRMRLPLLNLFDDALAVLNKYQAEDGAAKALAYLTAARHNFVHQDIDRLVISLALALNQGPRLRAEIVAEIQKVIREFAGARSETAAKMIKMAEEYESQGGKLLSLSEVLEEVGRRRGSHE